MKLTYYQNLNLNLSSITLTLGTKKKRKLDPDVLPRVYTSLILYSLGTNRCSIGPYSQIEYPRLVCTIKSNFWPHTIVIRRQLVDKGKMTPRTHERRNLNTQRTLGLPILSWTSKFHHQPYQQTYKNLKNQISLYKFYKRRLTITLIRLQIN